MGNFDFPLENQAHVRSSLSTQILSTKGENILESEAFWVSFLGQVVLTNHARAVFGWMQVNSPCGEQTRWLKCNVWTQRPSSDNEFALIGSEAACKLATCETICTSSLNSNSRLASEVTHQIVNNEQRMEEEVMAWISVGFTGTQEIKPLGPIADGSKI